MDVSKFNWPVTGADLEAWRVRHGLSKPEAAKAFGIPMSKWYALTDPDLEKEINASQTLDDLAVVNLYVLYHCYPRTVPFEKPTDVTDFYHKLGFGEELNDREQFATLIGRSVGTVYRMVNQDQIMGSPGRPVQCLIDGVERLDLAHAKKRDVMAEIANLVQRKHKALSDKQANKKQTRKGEGTVANEDT